MLEQIRERIARGQHSPVCHLLNMEVQAIHPGQAAVSLAAAPAMFNPFGTVHGGILCDLADMAMGTAFMSTLNPGEGLATVELKINFLRPAREEILLAEARVTHRGRTTGFVECEIFNAERKLVAKASSTCMVVTDARAAHITQQLEQS
jgi:uncharacterized protein (TIGR00369 family)